MKPYKKFKFIDFRYEKMGLRDNPYLKRWMIILFGYSIRLHHWIKSDDNRFYHDHSCSFISVVLKGSYVNCTPDGDFNVNAPSIWKSDALKRHWLKIPKAGAWTILLCGRPYYKWGFYVPRSTDGVIRRMRPLEYFHRYGIIQTGDYQ